MKFLSHILNKFFKKPEPNFLYEVIGLEEGIQKLVYNFYKIMETDPKAHECLISHELVNGEIPESVKNKFFKFLSGWFGGPNLFVEEFGHPRMRARHMHVKIGEAERIQWLYCMSKALDMHTPRIIKKDRLRFEGSFKALASRIQNIHT
jgi:hemoglobin